MEYLALIGTATVINFLALISPGPDFILCVRNSLTYSRRIGMWTAAGFATGIAIHILYSAAGLAVIISQSIILFSTMKYLGAAYLVYLGIKALRSKGEMQVISAKKEEKSIRPIEAYRSGFLTNVLNPKATLFILSFFTLVITPGTPAVVIAIIGLIMIASTLLWFSLVATLLTQAPVQKAYRRFQKVLEKTLGGILVLLGIKVALSDN